MADTSTSPEVVLAHLDSLPTLPAVAVRVLQLTADESSDTVDIIRLLRSDQSLTAKILSVAGSASAGVRGSVTTLEKAVPLIGFNAVRSIVLATSVFDCFQRPADARPERAFDPLEFWKHSLAVACAARRLARLRPELKIDPEDAFVAGLLHDLGKVALDTVFPRAYERIAAETNASRDDIADHERAVLGADHTVAGRRLAERWRLPRALQEAIWLHHLSADAMPASVTSPGLIGLVELADTVAREQRIGYSGNHLFYDSANDLAQRLGCRADMLSEVVAALVNDVAEQSNLLGLDGETPEAMYVKAMTRANAELGRMNADLVLGNQRLAAGARYFSAIRRFEESLADWADPSAVVVAVAEAAAAALQRKRVAVFGLRQNLAAVDTCWVGEGPDEGGRHTQSVPVDLIAWLGELRDRLDALVLPAEPVVCNLLATALALGERAQAWLLPIVHDQEVAGGIVYTSDSDERQRLATEAEELRGFLASLGLALGRANAQTAARRFSEDLADTNRRLQHMQVELLRSRTLSMIAEMASGAGHELNGPLTVISGRAQMLSTRLDDPEAQRVLEAIVHKAHECSGIVTELMDFARPQPPQLCAVDLPTLLANARMEFIDDALKCQADIEVRVDVDGMPTGGADAASLVRLTADPQQMMVVLRELIRNALAALPEQGGRITLACQRAPQPDKVELLVQDNGVGMSPAILQRAFDPFFSHRSAGRSRGLGLARAYRIVEAHGGRIWLESRPNAGSTAHMMLPRESAASA